MRCGCPVSGSWFVRHGLLLLFRLDKSVAKHDLRGLRGSGHRGGGGGRRYRVLCGNLRVVVVGTVQLGCRLQLEFETYGRNVLVGQRRLQVD